MFKISLLDKYRVKYYDDIVKWGSGIACDWFVSLDIAYILPFRNEDKKLIRI